MNRELCTKFVLTQVCHASVVSNSWKALVSFDDIPEVLVRMEQWGLDALTVGVVDEWVRIGLKRALKPFVLPG